MSSVICREGQFLSNNQLFNIGMKIDTISSNL